MVHSQLIPSMCVALIVFILFPLVICQKCPKECACQHKKGVTFAMCDVDNINSVNSIDLQPETTTALQLNCQNSSPSSLNAKMFQKLNQLMSVLFMNCSFDYIDKNTFTGLDNFEDFFVFNPVNFKLPPKFFHHIRNLKQLIISESDWHELSFDNFCVLINIRLLVFMKNPISNILENSTLCPGNQHSFRRLKKLILNQNEIQILRTGFAERFQSLQYLTFQGNKIKEIQNGSLVNLTQLEYLDVSHNYLQKLPDDFCDGCTELMELDISDNPITDIPASVSKMYNLRKFNAKNTLLSDISIVQELSLLYLNVINSNLNTISPPFCRNNSILEELYLGGNQMVRIPENAFENCNSLEKLDLSSNNIESLSDESFNGLPSLKVLYLPMNKISHIDNGTFSTLITLNILDLSSNFLTKLPLFPPLTTLLNLTGNQLRNINFYERTTLLIVQHLFINNNKIQTIKNYTFFNCVYLKDLHLNENGLRNLEEFAFASLLYLSHLHISYNYLEDFHSALKPLTRLNELEADHNLLSTLKRNTFPILLRRINVSKNKIKTIEEGTFENLKYLEMVDLRWNEIASLDSSSVKLNPNIIAVSNFAIFGNPLKCDCHLTFLKNTSVNKYPIFTDLAPSSECCQHDIYYLKGNHSESTDEKQFVCGYKSNSLFKLSFSCYLNCQCCLTENCLCQQKCSKNCLCRFRYDLTDFRVDCKNGNLTDAKGLHPNATLIDLSGNDLGYLRNGTFIKQTRAEILYLNHSKITGIGQRTFITFNLLKILHLEYNVIRMLDSHSLLGLWNLKELILHHNEIERILPATFNMTPNLEVLDLSHNNLVRIESQTFNANSLKTIALFENPWSCSCEDLKSLQELLITRSSEIDSESILCMQSQIPVLQYDVTFCQNKFLNSSTEMLRAHVTKPVYSLSIGLTLIEIVFYSTYYLNP